MHPLQVRIEAARWWRSHLKERCGSGPRKQGARRILISEIQVAVAHYYRISTSDLFMRTRQSRITRPRQVAFYLSKQLTGRSFAWIGSRFGGFDHSSVMHGCSKIEELIAIDEALADQVEEIGQIIARG